MANHRKKTNISLPSLNKRQWIRIGAVAAALALVATGGIITRSFYASDGRSAAQQVTAYSATDPLTVSRGSARDGVRGMDGDTSYVTVKLDGQSRTVLGTDFTTVKSVLEAGNITLGPNDTVDPALDAEVDESTVITIETADSTLETSEEPIAFNTVRKETSSLPEGTEQVETEGEEGVMETTSLVTRAGDTVISSNVFASYVKKAPVDKVILVGRRDAAVGTRLPAGQRLHRGRFLRHRVHHQPRVRLACECHQCQLRRVRPAPGAARQQDGLRRRRLGHQLPDPAQMVLGLLQQPLRFGAGRLQLLGGQPLVLIVTNEEARGFPGLLFATQRIRRRRPYICPYIGVGYWGHFGGWEPPPASA